MIGRPLRLWLAAAAALVLAGIVWLLAFATGFGARLDSAITRAMVDASARPLEPRIDGVAALADPRPFLLLGAVLVGIALVRRRPVLAFAVAVILGGSNLMTQILKPLLDEQRLVEMLDSTYAYNAAWPSGHSTASMSIALCAVLVAGPRWRWLAATFGTGYAVGVGYSLVALGWHLPSDVLGGYLMATAWALAGTGATLWAEQRLPARWPAARRITPADPEAPPSQCPPTVIAPLGAALGGLAALLAAAYAALSHAPDASTLLVDHASGFAAGAGIAVLGIALTAGMALTLRRQA